MFERFLVGPHLEFGGVVLERLVAELGTPLYIIDLAIVRAKCRAYMEYSGGGHVAYASKANSTLALLQVIREEGLDVDVASNGELHAALRAGFKGSQITVHGNAKSDIELQGAVEVGVRRVVIDEAGEIERLAMMAEAADKAVDVLVRVAPAVDPKTHLAIRTGQEDSKFGFNLDSGDAKRAIEEVKKQKFLKFKGLHFHVGSQLLNSGSHVGAVKRLAVLAKEVGGIDELIVGGGLGIRYTYEDAPQEIPFFMDSIIHAADRGFDGKPPKLGFEPGRSIVGEAGTTVYTAMVRKQVGRKTYLAVNGGMGDNPRPQLYDAKYLAFNASRPGDEHIKEFKIAGRHCETDTLIEEAMLPRETQPGDLIVVPSTGAYSSCMASNYNRYPRPVTVLVEGGSAFVACYRESVDQMFVNERLR